MHNLAVFSIAAAGLIIAAAAATPPPGTHDPSFDAGFAPPLINQLGYTAAALQPDGSVVFAGSSLVPTTISLALTRVFADGRYDYQYGTNLSYHGVFNALAFQPGLGLLVGGSVGPGNPRGSGNVFRVNANGLPDSSFLLDQSMSQFLVTHLAVLPDKSILVARLTTLTLGAITNRPPLLVRLTPNGSVDRRFHAPLVLETSEVGIEAIQVLDDERILASGRFLIPGGPAGTLRKLIRLLPDGTIDPDYSEPTNVASSYMVSHLFPIEDGMLAVPRTKVGTDTIVRLHSDGSEDWFLSNYIMHPPMRQVSGVLVQPDGYLIMAAPSGSIIGPSLARVRADGVEDTTFRSRSLPGEENGVNGLLPLPDGTLIAYGKLRMAGGVARPGFVRVLEDGTPDGNFGRMGLSSYPASPINLAPVNLIPLHDGLLIGGLFRVVNGYPVNQVAKLRLDGSVDLGFSTNAITQWPESGQKAAGYELPDGRILLIAKGNFFSGRTNLGAIIRLHSDGTIDPTYKKQFGPQAQISSQVLQPDGKLIVSGVGLTNGAGRPTNIVRYLPDGPVDPSFGLAWPAALPSNSQVVAMHIQNDGRIVVATAAGAIVRFGSNGQQDLSFQGLPKLASAQQVAIASLPSGDVYVAGYNIAYNKGTSQVGHWNPDGSFDTAFKLSTAGAVTGIFAVGEDRLLISGNFVLDSSSFARLVRCFPDGTLDRSFVLDDFPSLVQEVGIANGKIYVSGESRINSYSPQYMYNHVARYFNQTYSFAPPVLNEGSAHFLSFNFYAPSGGRYLFEASGDLETWSQITNKVVPANGVVSLQYNLKPDATAQFFRARPAP